MKFSSFIDSCKTKNVLVLGDLMLDQYMWGKVERNSPEAPIPVVDITHEEARAGGAANVALNLAALGAQTSICGIIGDDQSGEMLLGLLQKAGFDTNLVRIDPERPTTVKTRVIGNNKQMLRLDKEDASYFQKEMIQQIQKLLAPILKKYDAIILEDYDKGLFTGEFIQWIISAATIAGIPTIVDPKYRQFDQYQGCTIFKPNLRELLQEKDRDSSMPVEEVISLVKKLREKMSHKETVVTLGAEGILSYSSEGKSLHGSPVKRNILDVSGAGDTVAAVLALAYSMGFELAECAEMANMAGGMVCEYVGVVPINKDDFAEELRKRGRN